jgi:hypothetical protein
LKVLPRQMAHKEKMNLTVQWFSHHCFPVNTWLPCNWNNTLYSSGTFSWSCVIILQASSSIIVVHTISPVVDPCN